MATRSRRVARVVLDTNVVWSSLVFGGGTPGALRQAWQEGRCVPLVSEVTAAELIRANQAADTREGSAVDR